MTNKIDISDIEIQIKLPKKHGNVLAQATLVLFEVIEIHGFTVSKSQVLHKKFQEQIWVQPPKIRYGVFWKTISYCRDENLWQQIEEKIYDKYCLLRSKYPEKNEDIDINDIPDDLGKGI